MAQNYSELRKDNVRDAIYEDVANNLEVLRTSWAGNAFPENPKVGQACYRIDEDNLYFWDGTTWSQKGGGGIDMNTGDKLYDWVGAAERRRLISSAIFIPIAPFIGDMIPLPSKNVHQLRLEFPQPAVAMAK